MKLLKRLVISLLVLFFLLIVTVFILVFSYKKELTSMLVDNFKSSYGLTLKIEKVNVSFVSNWPNTSVQLKNVYLFNDLYSADPIIKAKSLSLSFDLRKLLFKKFVVNSIALKDAEINLVKNIEG